jgi:hypothetical protein
VAGQKNLKKKNAVGTYTSARTTFDTLDFSLIVFIIFSNEKNHTLVFILDKTALIFGTSCKVIYSEFLAL